MPEINVVGLSSRTQGELQAFCDDLVEAAAGVEELRLDTNQVSCFFPKDWLENGLGDEIMITVRKLYKKPERTLDVLNKLARVLGLVAKKYFPKALVECEVKPVDLEKDGFWTSS